MAWIYLLLAGLFEIGFAIGLKYTEGFTRLWPSVGTVVCRSHQPVAADPGLARDSRRHGLRDLDRHRRGGRSHAGRRSCFRKAPRRRGCCCIALIVSGRDRPEADLGAEDARVGAT